jgi:hypothetical protein
MDVWVDKLKHGATIFLKSSSPIRTGNLRYNSIKNRNVNGKMAIIYIDEAIAPYMPFTNEPWISPRWHGRQNPNERWFDNTAERFADSIERIYPKLKRVE